MMKNEKMHRKFLPLKLKSIETEGFSYFPRQEILIHDLITMLNGENGSGKTTLLNMFRVLFGARKFDNGHTLKTFFERDDISEIYIIGKFSNTLEYGRRPFQEIGKWEDDVTVVCRLTNEKQVIREYLIYDGMFDLEIHFNEKLHWLDVGQYLHQMSEVGMPRTLSNAFSLSQGKTEKVLEFTEEELAQYILQICGEQERIEQFNKIKIDLKDQKELYHRLCIQKQQEELTLKTLLTKINRLKQIKEHERTKEKLSFEQPLSFIHLLNEDLTMIDEQLNHIQQNINSLEQEIQQKQQQFNGSSLKKEFVQSQLNNISIEIENLQNEIQPLNIKINSIAIQMKEIGEFISKYEKLEALDIRQLKQGKDALYNQQRLTVTEATNVSKSINTIKTSISEIEQSKKVIYPIAVQKIRKLLDDNNIKHLIVSEQIDISDSKWRNAIEALLGNERFTIIVDPTQIIKAMKFAQKIEYPFWISPYRSCKLQYDENSVLTKIAILDTRIAGYLSKFSKYKMAATIEEAWNLANKDDSAILNNPYPYLVTNRGGKAIRANRIYCGKNAYQAQLNEFHNQLLELERNSASLKIEEEQLIVELQEVNQQIIEQENRLLLPEKQTKYTELTKEKEQLDSLLLELSEKRSRTLNQQQELINDSQGIFATVAKLEQQLEHDQNVLTSTINQKKEMTVVKEDKKQNIAQETQKLSKEQLKKVRDTVYLNSLHPYEYYKTEVEKVNILIRQLLHMGEPIEQEIESLIALEEKYRAHSTLLQNHLVEINNSEQQLEKLEVKHSEAREEYMLMVQDAFRKVKLSLESMAKEGNLQASINFFPYGEEKWRVDYKIGFHGKKPMSYRSNSKLSGGQKVVASLLLTLATIKADGILSFMILDEPFAHLDQKNMELVGNFLTNTHTQYIIAMPYSENLKVAYPFVNMSIQLKPKEPNDEVAPPITYGVINDEYIQQNTYFKP